MSIGRKNTSMEAGGSGRNREMKEIKGTGQVRLSQAVRQELIDDIYQRADIEACGVLLGTLINGNWQITQAHPLRNIAHSAVYFEFAPDDLLIMELTYPEQIIGVYHSHPTGYPQASSTDRENMQRVNMEQKNSLGLANCVRSISGRGRAGGTRAIAQATDSSISPLYRNRSTRNCTLF